LASLAETNPDTIRQAIAPLGDGTFAVRFYRNGQSVYVRVDGDLPVAGQYALAYAGGGNKGELWVPLMEKAYAFFRYSANSYSSLSGGWMSDVYTDVANASSTYRSLSGSATTLANYLQTQLQGGQSITLGSNWNASGAIIGSHAYMLKDITTTSQGIVVTVYNPWGEDGTNADSNSSDGLIKLTMAQFQSNFSAAVVCQI
jgi:hypothetical protein